VQHKNVLDVVTFLIHFIIFNRAFSRCAKERLDLDLMSIAFLKKED
jgi:hypothetical protein